MHSARQKCCSSFDSSPLTVLTKKSCSNCASAGMSAIERTWALAAINEYPETRGPRPASAINPLRSRNTRSREGSHKKQSRSRERFAWVAASISYTQEELASSARTGIPMLARGPALKNLSRPKVEMGPNWSPAHWRAEICVYGAALTFSGFDGQAPDHRTYNHRTKRLLHGV